MERLAFAVFYLWLSTLPALAADLPMVKACMSLMSPDMLFCTDAHEQVILCDVTDAQHVDCKTMPALVRSWRGHPERRELFYRKLYGATP
jgi:hypothetical protein